MDNLGLVIMGGTARGLGCIGFVRFLQEENIKIDVFAGSSSGSFVASLYALGYKWDQMVDLLINIDVSKYFKIQNLVKSHSLLTRETFRDEILKVVKEDINIEDLPVKLIIYATNTDNKQRVLFQTGSLIEAIITSCSYPLLLPVYKTSFGKLRDGDLLDSFSVSELKSLGVKKIIGVEYRPEEADKYYKDFLTSSISVFRNLHKSNYTVKDEDKVDYEFNFLPNLGYLSFRDIRPMIDTAYLKAQKKRDEILKVIYG